MTTRTTTITSKLALVAGLALTCFVGTQTQQAGAVGSPRDNFFARHPHTVGGQTGIDAFDPFAPIDLSSLGLGGGLRVTGVTVEAASGDEADLHCLPARCRAW